MKRFHDPQRQLKHKLQQSKSNKLQYKPKNKIKKKLNKITLTYSLTFRNQTSNKLRNTLTSDSSIPSPAVTTKIIPWKLWVRQWKLEAWTYHKLWTSSTLSNFNSIILTCSSPLAMGFTRRWFSLNIRRKTLISKPKP